jgi:hypothetical protein
MHLGLPLIHSIKHYFGRLQGFGSNFVSATLYAALLLSAGTLLVGCKKNITVRQEVYREDAENGIARNMLATTGSGYSINQLVRPFGGSNVIGNFNNTVLTISIDTLPPHNMIYLSMDFYTHDKWEGNRVGLPGIVDVWNIRINGQYQLSTNFSNVAEQGQAYPEWIGSSVPAPARSNAADTQLPGFCLWDNRSNGSTRYRIAFSRPHTEGKLLVQMNDALQGSSCEKSWSIDNVYIEAITN